MDSSKAMESGCKKGLVAPQLQLPQQISILGTGDYARAFGKRLLQAGYGVVFGSRRPGRRDLSQIDEELVDAQVLGISDAIHSSDVIILAIPHAAHGKTLKPFEASLVGRILVDVSNPSKASTETSNAEQLALLLPGVSIVKAFNTVSAYAMGSGVTNVGAEVQICADDNASKSLIMQLAREMGFNTRDRGGLKVAKDVEASTMTLFKNWRSPGILSAGIFIMWMAYGFFRYHYYKPNPYDLHRMPLNVLNKIFACSALTILAFTFMPGCIAGFIQIVRGTKYKRFPAWVANWMTMRKQLGLICLFMAFIHCIMSLALNNAGYFAKFYKQPNFEVPANSTKDLQFAIDGRLKWNGELIFTLGTLAFALMTLLGLTSLPSVGSHLNWREWRFVQSGLGYTCLIFATTHVMLKGVQGWGGKPFFSTVQGMSFIVLWLPWMVLFMKLFLSLPGISCYVSRIRGGYERGSCCGSVQAEMGGHIETHTPSTAPTFNFNSTSFSKDNPAFDLESVAAKTQTI